MQQERNIYSLFLALNEVFRAPVQLLQEFVVLLSRNMLLGSVVL
jgi:hypothetical protein